MHELGPDVGTERRGGADDVAAEADGRREVMVPVDELAEVLRRRLGDP